MEYKIEALVRDLCPYNEEVCNFLEEEKPCLLKQVSSLYEKVPPVKFFSSEISFQRNVLNELNRRYMRYDNLHNLTMRLFLEDTNSLGRFDEFQETLSNEYGSDYDELEKLLDKGYEFSEFQGILPYLPLRASLKRANILNEYDSCFDELLSIAETYKFRVLEQNYLGLFDASSQIVFSSDFFTVEGMEKTMQTFKNIPKEMYDKFVYKLNYLPPDKEDTQNEASV